MSLKLSGAIDQNPTLLNDVCELIVETRQSSVRALQASVCELYWKIGSRINIEILHEDRAEYGKRTISTLATQLTHQFGRSYEEKNLRRMVQFARAFSDESIVVSLTRQLTWTHFIALIPLKTDIHREFYAQMAIIEGWNVKTLRQKIDSLLYERTALSKLPETVIKKELASLGSGQQLTPNFVLRDPYVLDFLDLPDIYSEKDLEQTILHDLEKFLLELGIGFTFVERQKRMIIDGEDHYLDLLFYHRRLRRLVALELKLGKFKASYKGQVELYLRWLEKHETLDGELPPLGIILCAEGNQETVELLKLDASGIHVAEYLTELPPRDVLEQKLHRAIAAAKATHPTIVPDEEETP